MLIIYSKFGKFRNLPYICIIKVKQVVTIKNITIMKKKLTLNLNNYGSKKNYNRYG